LIVHFSSIFSRESTMSNNDPKPSKAQPPPQRVETLEDAIYKPTLSEDNSALKGTNPLVAIPTTILTYTAIAFIIFFVATKTEAGKKALEKTMGIVLDDEKPPEEDLPPPPPPPPPPAVVVPTRVEVKDMPPPPPVTDQEVVPDEAPKELPKIDYSLAYAGKSDSAGTNLGQVGGVPGAGTGPGQVGGGAAVVHDFDYREMVVTFQPPTPPYPKMAQAARIQGTVMLEMVIGTDGAPTTVSIISGHPHLQSHAIEYAKKWRFKPALVDGHPVTARFQLRLNFTLPR
jgi:protein TonB